MLKSNISGYFTYRNFFLLSLFLIAIGLSLSKPLISIGQILMAIVWIAEGNYKKKLTSFFKNKVALVLTSLFILHLLGLIYSANLDYGLNDVRRKIPLFLLPLLIASFDGLTKKEFFLVFKMFIAGVIAASFWSVFTLLGGLNITILDKRDLSRFTSHIRFGLEICLAIFGSVYFLIKEKFTAKYLWLGIICWLIGFLFLLESFTGFSVLLITTILLLLIYSARSKTRWIKLSFISTVIILSVGSIFITSSSTNDYYQTKYNVSPLKMLASTKEGEKYLHDTTSEQHSYKENGFLVWSNIAQKELEEAWTKRSRLPLKSKDLRGQQLETTLIRYLTSKGERKNASAINNLTDKEVDAIEKGTSNYKYLNMNSIDRRLHKIIWEYDNYIQGGNYNGHSVIMRWIFWNTAFKILKENPFIGVGTGDIQDAFDSQYEKEDSRLTPQFRLRAHNQYITFAITFGIIGVMLFMTILFYPFFKNKMYYDYFYLAFFSIILLSMLTEDTLETQVGITFFVFFNSILLLNKKYYPKASN